MAILRAEFLTPAPMKRGWWVLAALLGCTPPPLQLELPPSTGPRVLMVASEPDEVWLLEGDSPNDLPSFTLEGSEAVTLWVAELDQPLSTWSLRAGRYRRGFLPSGGGTRELPRPRVVHQAIVEGSLDAASWSALPATPGPLVGLELGVPCPETVPDRAPFELRTPLATYACTHARRPDTGAVRSTRRTP